MSSNHARDITVEHNTRDPFRQDHPRSSNAQNVTLDRTANLLYTEGLMDMIGEV